MSQISIKSTSLWINIENISAVFGNIDGSVYKCAHFYKKHSVLPQLWSNIPFSF